MKRSMQIVFVLVLSITSILFAPIAQAGQVVNHEAEALTLQSLGLLSGTDQGFELERIPTRVEGAVMLVRLLGKNEYAMQQSFTHPFSDVPAWASPYIGFMYANNLTTGTDPSSFSPNLPLTPNQYLSFVLRSLGYNDQNGDFQWDKAMDKSQAIGLLDSSSRNELESFRRNEMVLISYLSLREKLKDSNSTLLQKLVEEDKAVSPIKAEASGLYKSQPGNNTEIINNPIVSETDNRYLISNKDELTLALSTAMLELKTDFILDFKNYPGDLLQDFAGAVNEASEFIEHKTGVKDLLSNWQYSGNSESLNIKIQYRYSQESFAQKQSQNKTVQEKVKEIVAALIKAGMTDYDKEKALHDYIVNNCQYDYENLINNTIPDESYSPYGILILGRGVCQGYSEAFALLGKEASLECQVVLGQSFSFGQWVDHAWNIVKIDGKYHHLDVTFDDPISDNGDQILSYDFFNLTDTEIAKNHIWERSAYPVCTATN